MKYTLNILLLFALFQSSAQNLVPNPSFEDTVACPTGANQVYNAAGWNECGLSPDYFNACHDDWGFPQWGFSVPNNWGGYQQGYGNAYCALGTFAPSFENIREYIGTELQSPLVIGAKYFVSFKASLSLADEIIAHVATNNLGANFSTVNYSNANTPIINNSPQINHSSIITDTANWTTVQGTFIADSNYTFITIGNFFHDSLTSTVDYSSDSLRYAYYYIDDVCVSTDSLTCLGELGLNELSKPDKKLVRVIDTMGRETENKPNTVLIYMFSDGTTEKLFKVE